MLAAVEALAEAAYLFECPSTLTADLSSVACHCLAIVASEPSKIPVPWPVPEDCHFAPGLAGYTELCMVAMPPLPLAIAYKHLC